MPALAPGNFSKPMGKKTRELSLHSIGFEKIRIFKTTRPKGSAPAIHQKAYLIQVTRSHVNTEGHGPLIFTRAETKLNYTVLVTITAREHLVLRAGYQTRQARADTSHRCFPHSDRVNSNTCPTSVVRVINIWTHHAPIVQPTGIKTTQ